MKSFYGNKETVETSRTHNEESGLGVLDKGFTEVKKDREKQWGTYLTS